MVLIMFGRLKDVELSVCKNSSKQMVLFSIAAVSNSRINCTQNVSPNAKIVIKLQLDKRNFAVQ